VNEIIDNHALYANQEFDSDYNGKLFARLLSLYIPDHIYLGDFMGFAGKKIIFRITLTY
jgi:hypothetical protein